MKRKRNLYFLIGLFLTVFLLIGCSMQKKTKSESSSTSQKTTLQTKQSSEKSTDAKQTTEAHSESSQSSSHSNNEETLAPIDTGAVLKADYSSMAGTWKNEEGQTLTFDQRGLTTPGMTVSLLNIDQDGNLLLNVETGTKKNLTLYIVPANKTLSNQYFSNGQSDESDKTKDRIVSSESLNSGKFTNRVYYHVSTH
ncbi:DUF6287 domain-containing protein [Streptococcus mutans]|jgi:hypothetical protein|uniref:DUF6287 domain-containing protein n=3 Tax=Streptococcus mutans TaxID=1309 RepID=Q8DV27_STRMU|nr:DUF6287 domain-containing protein [Streptococcus mutans]EMB77929.1 hypothetical protein SMU44_07477 [Streptococcus mutans 11VS1]AAN58423.1 hypothetical protein SMU_690 [Streptococcus mutans UA159]AJD55075.1 hypothetical protein SMUFR_0602 [Streptococcus mutans UA159-FR]AMF85734.1 hypothetical protein APQ13_04590 [Streptococcus mutans]EMB60385.1 hypothetical protein SMU10_02906 [Streptococcus mutans 8ID3]